MMTKEDIYGWLVSPPGAPYGVQRHLNYTKYVRKAQKTGNQYVQIRKNPKKSASGKQKKEESPAKYVRKA